MTLTMRRSDRRDRQLCRLGVMLVVASLVINMMQPPAKAVVIDATAAFGAAAVTAAINGTTATTVFSGMGTAAATNGIVLYMDAYAAATGVAASGTALASTIATGILVAGGTLLVGAAAAALIGGFIDWMREQEGLEPGGDTVLLYDGTGYFVDGVRIFHVNGGYPISVAVVGQVFHPPATISINGHMLDFGTLPSGSSSSFTYSVDGGESQEIGTPSRSPLGVGIGYRLSDGDTVLVIPNANGSYNLVSSSSLDSLGLSKGTFISDSFSVQPKPEFQEIPAEIPDGQVLSIDTGLASLPAEDPQAAADAIMQSAIDGALAPTVSVETDPSVQPDPDPEPDPDPDPEPDPGTNPDPDTVPDLPSNLGDLGNALTTRFPFSIPWDIAKAVKLLAAPAKAPYWEVDLFAPIAYRFGGLGDTTIYLDFGKPEFEIIGVTTRLTSTIGFCLALAAATKRFIWTA